MKFVKLYDFSLIVLKLGLNVYDGPNEQKLPILQNKEEF